MLSMKNQMMKIFYTKLMDIFSKVASHKKFKKIKKYDKVLLKSINSKSIGYGNCPLTIHYKGRKIVQPSNKTTNGGAKIAV